MFPYLFPSTSLTRISFEEGLDEKKEDETWHVWAQVM